MLIEPNIISPEVAEYVEKTKIEEVLSDSVNEIFLTLPPDPFSQLRALMKKYTHPNFVIDAIEMIDEIIQDFKIIPALQISMTFQGNSREIFTYPIPYTTSTYESKLKENFDEVTNIFTSFFQDKLANYTIESVSEYDKMLNETIDTTKSEIIAISIANALSFSTFISMSLMKEKSLYSFITESYPDFIINNETIPNLGFSLFKTGKTMNSKVKFERFILFINNQEKLEENVLYDLINKIYASLRKVLTAGKAGENGMRLNNEGSYFPPQDTLNDILKLIEGIINEVNQPNKLFIGIDCNANNYYKEDSKTYEMDGFKKPPDAEQLIDFYIKLVTDHPLITYLEEPMAENDKEGWEKLIEKFEEEKPNIVITAKAKEEIQTEVKEEESKLKNENDQVKDNKKPALLDTLASKPEDKAQTEENKKLTEEEEGEQNNLSIRIGEVKTLSDMINMISKAKQEGDMTINLWDNGYETNQSVVVDFGIGMRVDNIILHGLSMREEKLSKIIKYIETVKELY